MSGFTGSVEENPPDGTPFNRGFEGACPACGEPVPYEILLDLYNTSCKNCGTYAILYFWGKEEGPHMSEDLAYMFCEEGLMTEEHLQNALETKRQSEPAPLIELLLSIQYVTVSELEDLARELIPEEWARYLSGEQYRQGMREAASEAQKLARPEVDALYALLDQIYSGCGYPFSRMESETLERVIRGLGGDLTAGDIRNNFGALLLEQEVLAGEITEGSFARAFSQKFSLDFEDTAEVSGDASLKRSELGQFAEQCVFPLETNEEILRVGIPGHLVSLGFQSFFELKTPAQVRENLEKSIEFSVMPFSRIQQSYEANDLDLPVEQEKIDELLETALNELGSEIITRYEALDERDQPVAPGQEAEHPASTLRAIFQSFSLSADQRPDGGSGKENELQSVWLYHPNASEQIPPVVDRVTLDELDTWAENQMTDQEVEQPEVREREADEVKRLAQAFSQLREMGEVHPDKLNLPVDILDGVTEVEAGIYDAIPLARAGGFLWFGISDPEPHVVDELSAFTGETVRAVQANTESVKEVLVRFYGVRKGDWRLEHREEEMMEQDAFETFLELHGLTENRSELNESFPRVIARELDVVPLEITPENFILACKQRPDFLDRQLLQLLFRRSVSYRFVSDETFDELFETVYKGGGGDPQNVTGSSGTHERWDRENIEDLIGAPLSLEEIQTTQALLEELDRKKQQAPDVRVVTDHDTARSFPPVHEEEGRLQVDANAIDDLPSTCWTPAMETYFPVLPLQEMSNELLFASSSLDRRWFLDLLGLFTGRPSHVVILPNRTIEDVSRKRKGDPGSDIPDKPAESEETESLSASRYMEYTPSHLFESFHELAEENQLKKFILLLMVYLFEHDQYALRIVTEGERCLIQRWNSGEDREELFSIDNAHIYGLRYAFQEMAGKSLTDFRTDQNASFHFVYRGEQRDVNIEVNAQTDGQELLIDTRK